MKPSPRYLFICNLLLCGFWLHAQVVKKDTVPPSEKAKKDTFRFRDVTYTYGISLGAEYGKLIQSALRQNRQQYEVFAKIRVYRRWHVVLAYGREKFFYDDLKRAGWWIQTVGPYTRIGFDYAFFQASYNTDDNVYIGLRYGNSTFDQTIKYYVIRTHGGAYSPPTLPPLPKARVQTHWLGIAVGAQTEIFNTGFYLGVQLNPRFKWSEKRQDGIENIYTPGFGEDINGRSFDYQASISYRIPLFKRRVKQRVKVKG